MGVDAAQIGRHQNGSGYRGIAWRQAKLLEYPAAEPLKDFVFVKDLFLTLLRVHDAIPFFAFGISLSSGRGAG
jgi:hypothetical protein